MLDFCLVFFTFHGEIEGRGKTDFPSLWLKILYSLQGKWSESPLDWKVGAVSFLRVILCISKVWLPLSVKFRRNTQRVSVYLIEAKVD